MKNCPLKSNIDTQNDAMFEAGDTFFQGPSFLVSMLDFGEGSFCTFVELVSGEMREVIS